MKQKLLDLLQKAKPLASKAYSLSPFACGLVLGYFGHEPIKLLIALVSKIVG